MDTTHVMKQQLKKELHIYFDSIKIKQMQTVPPEEEAREEYFCDMMQRIVLHLLNAVETDPTLSDHKNACRRSSALLMVKHILEDQLNYVFDREDATF